MTSRHPHAHEALPPTRRELFRGAAMAAAGFAGPVAATRSAESRLGEARALHRRIPVFIGYCVFHAEQFLVRGGTQCDLEKLDAAGVRTFVASVGFGYGGPNQPYFQIGPREFVMAGSDDWLLERQLKRIDELVAAIQKCPRTRLVTRAGQLVPEKNDSIGVIVHLIGNNHTVRADVVDTFFKRGVRATHPAMEYHSRWCASQNGMPAPVLTGFGRQVIARMNDLGIVLDTAHASDASAQALVEASARPVIDTHTTSRDLVPLSRGLRDETLIRIARSGGVVGIHFADHMLTTAAWRRKYSRRPARPRQWQFHRYILARTKDPDERIRLRNDRATQDDFYRKHNLPPDPPMTFIRAATLSELADAVEYLIKRLGIDHVAIGGDVNGIDDDAWPESMVHIGQLPYLTAELLARKYNEVQLRKLLSDNWRRVYARCLPK